MNSPNEAPEGTFWDHLDALRACLLKALLATALCTLAAFCFRHALFHTILAPKNDDFITYRLLARLSYTLTGHNLELSPLEVRLINTTLAGQFTAHVRTSILAGICLASPYTTWLAFGFISPALYAGERRLALHTLAPAVIMFILGVAMSYYVIFPFTFRFLGTYQVSSDVANTITLQSYLDTFLLTMLVMGLVFEIPVLCRLLARMGLLNAALMRRYRRHAIVAILILSAIITPTPDAFTLMLVAVPIYMLYETGIIVTKFTRKKLHRPNNQVPYNNKKPTP